ncbi:MAG: MarR family transcriptional regulator [Chloroflexi bacterium]|nr:MarR family transcriptional regulator [Chloroflexota bacterium]
MNENSRATSEEAFLLLRHLVRTGRIAEARLDGLLGNIELSVTKLLTLRQLEQTDEPLSLSQLAFCLAFVKSNATQVVDHLETDGLVKRLPAPHDRRCTLLGLTEEGQERYEAARAALQPLITKIYTLYTPEERTQLLTLLQRLEEGLK